MVWKGTKKEIKMPRVCDGRKNLCSTDFLMGIFSGPSRSTVYLNLGVEFLYAQSKEAQQLTAQKKAGCTAD
jgi:hypothetical protein